MAPQLVKREDLIVPYVHVKATSATEEASGASFVSQSMPMAAMFMKNKLLSWFSLFSAVVSLMYEYHGQSNADGSQSGLLRILTSVVGLFVCYMELVFPGSTLGPQAKVKQTAAQISETIAAAAASATA